MNDLTSLLDRSVAHVGDVDPTPDLARGHRALARSRRRRGSTGLVGLVGLAAAGVLGVGAAHRLAEPEPKPQVAESVPAEPGALQTVPAQAGPYSFAVTPVGWSIQGHRPGSVTFAADDWTGNPHPDAFDGKLVVLYLGSEPGFGQPTTRSGREFHVLENGDGMIVATPTRTGEPEGSVGLQVPPQLGWSVDTAIEMLSGVTVGREAEAPERNPDVSYSEGPDGYIIFGDD